MSTRMPKRILSILLGCLFLAGVLPVALAAPPRSENPPNDTVGTARRVFSGDPFAQMTDELFEQAQNRPPESPELSGESQAAGSIDTKPERTDAVGPASEDGISRYIVKYKDDVPQAAQSFRSQIADRLSESRAIDARSAGRALPLESGVTPIVDSSPSPNNFEVIILDEPVLPSVFANELRTMDAGQYISYIQPDYPMSLGSLSLELDEPMDGVNEAIDNSDDVTESAAPDVTSDDSPDEIESVTDNGPGVRQELVPQSSPVVVALIDTGLQPDHPLLGGYISQDGWNFPADSPDIYDPDNLNESTHGSHVAGLITSAAEQTGADISILPLKVFEKTVAYTGDILAAILYAQDHNAQIANMSFGSPAENRALYEIIEGSDMLFVCAAGNNRRDLAVKPSYPASYSIDLPNVISVTSTNADGGLSYYSNYGPVDVAAQGRDVTSALPGDKTGPLSGTSMSAGTVTGVAGAVCSLIGVTDAAELRERLLYTADRLDNLEGKVIDGRRVNLDKALSGAAGAYLSLDPADDFDVFGYNPSESELFELYSQAGGAVQVASGGGHTLVLMADGTVFAIGDNSYGQLGNGGTTSSETLVQVIGLSNVTAVSAGQYHSMASCSDGTVWTWGYNSSDQLGHSTNDYYVPFPVQVPLLSFVSAISAGAYHSMAIAGMRSAVSAWGSNGYGQLNMGLGYPTSISAGSTCSMATDYTGMYICGTSGGYMYSNTAMQYMPWWSPVRLIAASKFFYALNAYNLAVLEDETIVVFTKESGYARTLYGPQHLVSIVQGPDNTVMLDSDGTIWEWNPNNPLYSNPIQMSELSSVVSVAAGGASNAAVLADGTVWIWGGTSQLPLQQVGLSGQGGGGLSASIALNITQGTQFPLSLKGSDMTTFDNTEFTLTYDSNMIELVDFAAQTGAHSLAVGEITGTPLTILSYTAGELIFTYDKTIPTDKAWSGIMTVLRFEALGNGNTEVTIGNGGGTEYVTIGSLPVGSIIQIPINGTPTDFIVVQHGKPSVIYDDSFIDGTMVLMKDIYEMRQWNNSYVNCYADSGIHSYLNSTFINLIGTKIQSQIIQVKIPYNNSSGTVSSGANGLPAKIFLLSAYELDERAFGVMPPEGDTLSYFVGTAASGDDIKRVAFDSYGTPISWWTRTPPEGSIPGGYIWYVTEDGELITNYVTGVLGVRPALVLPSSFLVPDTGATMSFSQTPLSQGIPQNTSGQEQSSNNTMPVQQQAALPPQGDANSLVPPSGKPDKPDDDEE